MYHNGFTTDSSSSTNHRLPTNNSCSEEITDQIIEETYAAVTEGGSNNTIDSGADADESGLEVDYSNVYKLDDEDGDWEQWEEEDFMSNEDSNDEWLPGIFDKF